MRILLDTHVFLWWSAAHDRLSVAQRDLLQGQHDLLSIASIWAMQIRIGLGKLELALPLERLIGDQQRTNGIVLLPISIEDIFALQELPPLHRDPFDRLLVSQALVEDLSIMTADDAVRA